MLQSCPDDALQTRDAVLCSVSVVQVDLAGTWQHTSSRCACTVATYQPTDQQGACWARLTQALPADEDASGAEAQVAVWTDDGSLPLDSQGQLPFFLLDAHDEIATPGLVYLFGKVNKFSTAHCLSPIHAFG